MSKSQKSIYRPVRYSGARLQPHRGSPRSGCGALDRPLPPNTRQASITKEKQKRTGAGGPDGARSVRTRRVLTRASGRPPAPFVMATATRRVPKSPTAASTPTTSSCAFVVVRSVSGGTDARFRRKRTSKPSSRAGENSETSVLLLKRSLYSWDSTNARAGGAAASSQLIHHHYHREQGRVYVVRYLVSHPPTLPSRWDGCSRPA